VTSQLVGSDFTGGTRLPNYVNGRLLVAEDLATGQASLTRRDTRIGEAAGAGIVRGLWVTGTATALTVAPGLALSRSGEPVAVQKGITLPLTFSAPTSTPDPSRFTCCIETAGGGTDSTVPGGFYLLTARPACQFQGQAPLAPPPDSTASPACTAQWRVEGVEFRAVSLPLGTEVAGITVTDDNRRNLSAHWCLGTELLADLPRDPFSFQPPTSGFDLLDPADLTGCDVPLAVFHWNGQAVADLDNWSARRRVTTPDPVTASWSALLADRREADGQARFLQFQDHVGELVDTGTAGAAVAATMFGLLPPVGFLPVGGQQIAGLTSQLRSAAAEHGDDGDAEPEDVPEPLKDVATLVRSGFDIGKFFGPLARFGGLIDWEVADFALRQSWYMAPVPTQLATEGGDDGQPSREPLLTFYLVRQNLSAVVTKLARVRETRRSPAAVGFPANLYVVFMVNLPWFDGTLPPIIPGRFLLGG
jgi:hypothetical protein